LPVKANGRVNKLFCCNDHRRAYYVDRRAIKAAASSKPPKFYQDAPSRHCEREGCTNELTRLQRRFCSIACYNACAAQYTAAQEADVRHLFFDKHHSLRSTARETGLTLGKVTRIIYEKNAPKGGAQR
jgi:hypothetical protein